MFTVLVKRNVKENTIETGLVRRVHAAGGLCEKVTVLGYRGYFDRLVVLPGGRVVFCEVKRPKGGKMSAHQWQRKYQYEKLGCEVAIIATPADIDRLLKE